MVGHDGESRGGMVVSLMTFRESGLVVVVMSNISHADTSTLALKIAEAFAEARPNQHCVAWPFRANICRTCRTSRPRGSSGSGHPGTGRSSGLISLHGTRTTF